MTAAAVPFADAAVDLTVAREWVTIGGRRVELLTYNGSVPGPVIEIEPGREIRIRLRNALSSPTNLHFHGLHMPPSIDDPFLLVPPGEEHEYRFTLDPAHRPGTYWYHPHVHHHSAEQVGGGLAGAILVRTPSQPAIDALPERVVVLQDFDLNSTGQLAPQSNMDRMVGREGDLVTVSGSLRPELNIARDGWLRLRIVNASPSRFYNLSLEEHPFLVIGTDGGFVRTPYETATLLLTPGERADVLIRGNRNPGVYRLRSLPYSRVSMMMMMMRSQTSAAVELATLAYEGTATGSWMPPTHIGTVDPLPAGALRRFTLGGGGMMGGGMMRGGGGMMSMTINSRAFDENRVDTRVRIGATEEWEWVNATNMDHPVHIHTNSFQVVGNQNEWKDTVLVKAGSRKRIRIRFDKYTGKTVYHCHILDHEDMGMMGTLQIGA